MTVFDTSDRSGWCNCSERLSNIQSLIACVNTVFTQGNVLYVM